LKKIWKLKNLYPEREQEDCKDLDIFISEIRNLKSKVKLPDKLTRLLYSRGITDYVKLIKFFKPTVEKLYDPFLMKDCDIATERIIKAVNSKEKIMILGDYDVDGTCGASMFYLFLKHFGIDASVYIPDRIKEGYGISVQAIDKAKEDNTNLIVSIDCGITAFDKVEYAKTLNIDFIICDHHQAPDHIPAALAVLDPLRRDCSYPFKYLCGAGVAFKLIQAICTRLNKPEYPNTLLDFVAIATSSDIVPITDENRILVNEGFKLINANPRPAIKTLLEKIGLKNNNINTTNIVYTLAPRINAVGRLGDAKRAVELLTSDDDGALNELAQILDSENSNRRELDKSITEDAFKLFEEKVLDKRCCSIVLHNRDWHPGVIGIVAARLVEKYNLPAIVLTTVNGVAKGSARSINGFNIYEALKKCENKLIQFGGHNHAAGLEIALENIEDFKETFNEIACSELKSSELIPEIEIDIEVELDEITNSFVNILAFFEPYGPGNAIPLFQTNNVQIVGTVRKAKSDTHIFKVRDSASNKMFEAVFFTSKDFENKINPGEFCDICYSIDKNKWNGRESIKLRIRDMHFITQNS
jgi:single-stranded-DNA-specific exonuclease